VEDIVAILLPRTSEVDRGYALERNLWWALEDLNL